jgi:hypothetical protein
VIQKRLHVLQRLPLSDGIFCKFAKKKTWFRLKMQTQFLNSFHFPCSKSNKRIESGKWLRFWSLPKKTFVVNGKRHATVFNIDKSHGKSWILMWNDARKNWVCLTISRQLTSVSVRN